MPFTTAHIAAVLPINKHYGKYFSTIGLIIGSVSPDLEYIIRMTLLGHYGHTTLGIFIFDLPVGFALYIIYYGIIHKKLIAHLPQILYSRFSETESFEWIPYLKKNFFIIIISLFVGTITHLVWDSFTHDKEYLLARYLTILVNNVTLFGRMYPVYAILQVISTIVGMIFIFWFIHQLPQKAKIQRTDIRKIKRYWLNVIILAILIGIIRLAFGIPNEKLLGQLLVISMSASLLSLIIVSWLSKSTLK